MFCVGLTERVVDEDVVEDAVRDELAAVHSLDAFACERLQLRLTLVELLVVALLQCDARMRLVHRHREAVANALNLQQDPMKH